MLLLCTRGASVSEDLEVASGEQDSRLDAYFVCAREAAESREAPLFESDSLCTEVSKRKEHVEFLHSANSALWSHMNTQDEGT